MNWFKKFLDWINPVSFYENPYQTYNQVSEYFLKPKKVWFFGIKTKLRWNPFMYVQHNRLVEFCSMDVEWKDKWNTPRYEYPPQKYICLFGGRIWFGYMLVPQHKNYDSGIIEDYYWEHVLWTAYYTKTYNKADKATIDIEKARSEWGWRDMEGHSTWRDDFLKEEYRKK